MSYNCDKCRHCRYSVEIITYSLRYWDRKTKPHKRYICKKNNDLRVDLLDKDKIKNCKDYEIENT